MSAYVIDPPNMTLSLHPRLARHASSPTVARLALLNYVAERAVLFEPMSPEELLTRAFAPPRPRLILATDAARQRAYWQFFLGAITVSDRDVEDSIEVRELLACLSWLARQVDKAIR